jgi:hypothetical protein
MSRNTIIVSRRVWLSMAKAHSPEENTVGLPRISTLSVSHCTRETIVHRSVMFPPVGFH